MARPVMNEVDYADVQGLLRFGYGRLIKASYALLRVKDAAAARAWLRTAPVSNAMMMDPPPATALQVAFTAPGLRALGVPEPVIAGFSLAFRSGMAQESRARQLGDVKTNAPEYWQWGGPASEVHLVVMFFAHPDTFDAFVQGITGDTWGDSVQRSPLAQDRESRRYRTLRFRRRHQPATAGLGTATARPPTPSSTTAMWSRSASSCSGIAMNTA